MMVAAMTGDPDDTGKSADGTSDLPIPGAILASEAIVVLRRHLAPKFFAGDGMLQ